MRSLLTIAIVVASLLAISRSSHAAELVTLTAQTWDRFAPSGKEADRIYGDFVLRNEHITVVIARPIAGRHANMTVRNTGGAIIDLTSSQQPNDQLSAYYPGGKTMDWRGVEIAPIDGANPIVTDPAKAHVNAEEVSLTCKAEGGKGFPEAEVQYTLADDWSYVHIETVYRNHSDKTIEFDLFDEVRADNSFSRVEEGDTNLFWVYDKWWGQAYGVVADGVPMEVGAPDKRGLRLHFHIDDQSKVVLHAGATLRLTRRLFPANSHLHLRQLAKRLAHESQESVTLEVVDTAGRPIVAADVEIVADDQTYGTARTGADGKLAFALPEGEFRAKINSPPHGETQIDLRPGVKRVELPRPGEVVAKITNDAGRATPCKVEFRGLGETESPFFNHASGEHGVQNLYYSHDGEFRVLLAPGQYECIVSYGSEHDAVFKTIDVTRGNETPLRATLVRSVNTPGWVSADFHSHSSPSGDNTASQLGRVLNLLCEHIEFAPCTEHNRFSSYDAHLQRLKVQHLLATCIGIELTDLPGDVNHHNAFPFLLKPRIQDNGAPLSDSNVEVKVERLAMWDGRSEKVIEQNHPDIGHVFYDRDGDGSPDGGYRKMFKYLDCIEIHPPQTIFDAPLVGATGRKTNNRMFNWLQLLNQGYRLPGVVNTDAHYNFHGSGFLRIYLRSSTDDPARITTAEMVRAVKQGEIVMTTGPYLEVFLEAAGGGERSRGTVGADIHAPSGECTLAVRVQCPNWFDIDRVQVLVSGRAPADLNFTRDKTPQKFQGGVVKFDQKIPLQLKADEHIIVVAAGTTSTHGPVRGPDRAKDKPFAVSNPIYVDVDGGGFKANGDTLGAPLPVSTTRTP